MRDQTTDSNGSYLYKLDQTFDFPEFVKSASDKDILSSPDLPIDCFAEPGRRQLPFHTKAACLVSFAALIDNKPELKPAQYDTYRDCLLKAASYWNVREDCLALEKSLTKSAQAAPEVHYALVIGTEKRFPLRNEAEVRKAAEYLDVNRQNIPFTYRHQMAGAVLKEATELKVTLTADHEELLEKLAGNGWCAAADVRKIAEERAALIRGTDNDAAAGLLKLAEVCNQDMEKVRQADLVKLAGIIDQLDRDYNLIRDHGHELTPLEDAFFGLNTKIAEEALETHISTTSGSIYRIEDLDRVKLAALRDTFGDEFADLVSAGGLFTDGQKLAEQAHTLPRHEAEILDKLLAEVGVQPVAKEAAHEGSWLTQDTLQELAQM